jgi:hypothetical protein
MIEDWTVYQGLRLASNQKKKILDTNQKVIDTGIRHIPNQSNTTHEVPTMATPSTLPLTTNQYSLINRLELIEALATSPVHIDVILGKTVVDNGGNIVIGTCETIDELTQILGSKFGGVWSPLTINYQINIYDDLGCYQ